MNNQERYELVLRAQAGNADAMEQLLLWTYTPLLWLCRKLLQDQKHAEEQTESILNTIYTKLDTLQDPEQYEAWFCRIAAARCTQILPQLRWGTTARSADTAPEGPNIDGKALTEEETIQAVSAMVDKLPEDTRVCILLYCCAGIHSKTISSMAGYSVESVRNHLGQGQILLQEMLNAQEKTGTTFRGITTLQDILRAAMYQIPEGCDPIPMVYGILGKEIPDPEKALRRVLKIVIAVLSVLLVILSGVLFLTWRASHLSLKTVPMESYTLPPVTQATTAPAETTAATTEATTEATTKPTEAATVPTTAPAETVPQTTAVPTQPSSPAASQPTTPPAETTAMEKTAADGHTHNFKTYSAVNCETGGTKRHDCTLCDYSYTETLQPTGSHTLTIVPTSSAGATCTSAGKAAKICTKCNYAVTTDDPDKPALGHNYESTVVAPTSTEKGYTLHKCTRCSDSYQDSFVDPVAAPAPQESDAAPEV